MTMRDATAVRPVAAGQFLWGAVQGWRCGSGWKRLVERHFNLETRTTKTINYLKGILLYYVLYTCCTLQRKRSGRCLMGWKTS